MSDAEHYAFENDERPLQDETMNFADPPVSHAAICAAMAKAFPKIGSAIKGHVNPAFKGSKYADLAAVIDVIKPALSEHGLWFAQINHPSDKGVTIETVLFHESGESLSLGTLFLPATKLDAQGFGSAATYCRRYALMAAFGVPAEDDDGNAAVKSQTQEADTAALEKARKRLEAADSVEDLTKAWKGISAYFKATPAVLQPLAKLKDERLADLEPA